MEFIGIHISGLFGWVYILPTIMLFALVEVKSKSLSCGIIVHIVTTLLIYTYHISQFHLLLH